MNHANLGKSDRLKRVDVFLADRMPHSTMEIIQATNCCAINSIVAELRMNKRRINCHRRGNVWYYRRIK